MTKNASIKICEIFQLFTLLKIFSVSRTFLEDTLNITFFSLCRNLVLKKNLSSEDYNEVKEQLWFHILLGKALLNNMWVIG